MFVLLNPAAGGGRARNRWASIETEFRDLVAAGAPAAGPVRVRSAGTRSAASHELRRARDAGERFFVAAGGDGTVNTLLSLLEYGRGTNAPDDDLLLGAVGLGSSNDFHKPVSERLLLDDVPVRVDPDGALPHDVGWVRFRDEAGALRTRPWLVNASVGVTADANALFDRPGVLLGILKRVATGTAIAYATARTLATAKPRTLGVRVGAAEETWIPVSNLGVVKNPHFAGCLRYDSPHAPGDGSFHVHLLEGTGRTGLLVALAGLARGRFAGLPGARSVRASRLSVRSRRPFALETDGEVDLARSAVFTLSPGHVRVCG